jgi:DNA-binding CsgD family transcriptional regulator
LTEREDAVARLLLKGLSNAEIARVAAISEKTVKQHIGQIFSKAGVASRSEFFASIFPL